METLGDKLRRIEAAKTEQAAKQEAANRAAAEESENRRRQSVRQKFEAWKQEITSAIDLGMVPPKMGLPFAPRRADRTGSLISEPQNPDHDLYLELERWASDQGLEVSVAFADGRGGGGDLLTVRSKP